MPAEAPCATGPGVTTLVSEFASKLAFDDQSLYIGLSDRVAAMPLGGGTMRVLASVNYPLTGLAVDSANLYFNSLSGLYSVGVAGGAEPRLLQNHVDAFAADGSSIWWWSRADGLKSSHVADGTIRQIRPSQLVTVRQMVAGPNRVLMHEMRTDVAGMPFGTITTVAKDGSDLRAVVPERRFLGGFTVDGENIYFAEHDQYSAPAPSDEDRIVRSSLDGTNATILATRVQAGSFAVDQHTLYFTTYDSVEKIPKAGGPRSTIAAALNTPGEIAVHGGNVYWINATAPRMDDPNPGYAVMTACK